MGAGARQQRLPGALGRRLHDTSRLADGHAERATEEWARVPQRDPLRDGVGSSRNRAASRGGFPSRARVSEDGEVSSRIAAIAIDAVEPRVVAAFWCAVLDWQVVEEDVDGISIAPPDRPWPMIDVLAVPEGKGVKNRLHLDLRADGSATGDELDRLLALGARRADVGQGSDCSWVVLADPEGNEFCLLSRSVQEL